jgi:hypothetical protein
VFSYFRLLIFDTKYCRDHKIRITLWGELAHFLSEDVIGKHTVLIVTSTMVEGLQGNLFNKCNLVKWLMCN